MLDGIAHEIARDFRHINLYGLYAADGQSASRQSGKSAAWIASGWRNRTPYRRRQIPELWSSDREVRALAQQLAGGETLIVARDVALLKQIRTALLRGCFLIGAIILGLGILGGVFYSLPAVRHIREINNATRRIVGGDYSQRLPVGKRNHELDALWHTSSMRCLTKPNA